MNRFVAVSGVVGLGLTSGIASADAPSEVPVVATTFSVGAGPMPDVATDSSTQRAYVTSQGDDSLYILDGTGRVGRIAVGPAPRFAAVDPTTQTGRSRHPDAVHRERGRRLGFGDRHRNPNRHCDSQSR